MTLCSREQVSEGTSHACVNQPPGTGLRVTLRSATPGSLLTAAACCSIGWVGVATPIHQWDKAAKSGGHGKRAGVVTPMGLTSGLEWWTMQHQRGGKNGGPGEEELLRTVADRIEWCAGGTERARNTHEARSPRGQCG